ncbi:ABC transporter ATP-binding protein [bacterium]|nr:ABC transporter ATP-binding protein [bacterium]
MIHVDCLTKFYGPNRALDGLSFDVPEGEILGFLGPNGAGKTTTMKILTGLALPTSGSAQIGGFDVTRRHRDVHRLLGYLPEEAPLYPEMTVRSYLKFVAGMKLVEARDVNFQVDRSLEETGLSDVGGRLVGNLSKGMRQRVGLAQALLGDPRVLILDEPTVGLDPSQISEIRDLIHKMRGHRTVILSTHILPEVAMTCTRVVILNQGRIVTQGPVKEIGQQSAERRVRVHVQGLPAEAADLLREAAPDTEIEVLSGAPKGEGYLRVKWQGRMEFRPLIARAILDGGMELLDLHEEEATLEEIFLRAINDPMAKVGTES